MTERPLIQLGTPGLQQYFEEHANTPDKLKVLAAELACRKRRSAKKLHGEVLRQLKVLSNGSASETGRVPESAGPKTVAEKPAAISSGWRESAAQPITHDWDACQRLIIECDEDEMSLVEAGPGSGKTAVACQRVAYLVERKGVEASNILLISFTRAAIKELRDRIRSFAENPIELAGLQIVTLDSFTWQMLHGFTETDAAKLLQGYDGNISGFVELLKNPTADVEDAFDELEHLVVDEAQDLVGDRASLTLALIDRLPGHCGVTIFADSAQAIYGFTTDQGTDGPAERTLVERLSEGGAYEFGHQHLTNVYRTQDPQLLSLYAKGREQLVGKSTASADQWKGFRAFIDENAHGHVPAAGNQDLAGRTDVLVLYRTRAEALMASSMLWSNGVSNKLRMSGIPPRTYPWIARVLCGVAEPSVRENEFAELWSASIGDGQSEMGFSCEQAWRMLYDNVGQKGRRVSMSRLRSLLGRDRPPIDFLVDERSLAGPVLGTIHASKGRESRVVHLMLPREDYVNGDMDQRRVMEEQRVLFVGASRAREELKTGKGSNLYPRRLDTSGRTYRMLAKSKGQKVQAEIGRLNDVDAGSVVDEEFRTEEQSREWQNWLWEQRDQSVELLSKYHRESNRNILLTAADEEYVAALSTWFSKDLWKLGEAFASERKTGKLRPGSKISFIRQVGVRTAVIPEVQRDTAHAPWRESGLVLVPVISGFSPIFLNDWSN